MNTDLQGVWLATSFHCLLDSGRKCFNIPNLTPTRALHRSIISRVKERMRRGANSFIYLLLLSFCREKERIGARGRLGNNRKENKKNAEVKLPATITSDWRGMIYFYISAFFCYPLQSPLSSLSPLHGPPRGTGSTSLCWFDWYQGNFGQQGRRRPPPVPW